MELFLENGWYAAGWVNDLGAPCRRVILGRPVVLFREGTGRIRALEDVCPHRFAPLSLGTVVGDDIQCPYHGLRINGEGRCTYNPHGDHSIPPQATVRSFPAAERYGAVWLWMGDPTLASPASLPEFPLRESSGFKAVTGSMTVKANYQLVTDNLLDLSHVQYLHPQLRVPNEEVKIRQEVKQSERQVSAYLWRDNALPNALQKLFWPEDRIGDARAHMHWVAPSSLFLDVGITECGTSDAGVEVPSFHFLTPAGPFETHYFWAFLRNRSMQDGDLDAQIEAIGREAFEQQDKPIIEAQQENLGAATDVMARRPALLAPDGAAVRARRLLARLIRQQAGSKDELKLMEQQ